MVDIRYGGDIVNLKTAAINPKDLLDELGNLDKEIANKEWAEGPASPNVWRLPRRGRGPSPEKEVKEELPVRQVGGTLKSPTNTIVGGNEKETPRKMPTPRSARNGETTTSPVKNRGYGYTSRGTSPRRARNIMKSGEENNIVQKKKGMQKKIMAISKRNQKVCVVI